MRESIKDALTKAMRQWCACREIDDSVERGSDVRVEKLMTQLNAAVKQQVTQNRTL